MEAAQRSGLVGQGIVGMVGELLGPQLGHMGEVMLDGIDPVPGSQRWVQGGFPAHRASDLGECLECHSDVLDVWQRAAREQAHTDRGGLGCLVDPQRSGCVIGPVLGEQGQGMPFPLGAAPFVECVELDADRRLGSSPGIDLVVAPTSERP